jgi:mono/diheme cytochrome c family protein
MYLVAVLVALAAQAPPDSGAALFQAWCKSCHGTDGRGVAAASTRLEVPPADLHDCKGSSAEPEARWVGIVTKGGAAFGLSLDMPAFGEAATPEQIRAVVRYARSLCGERGWPPGELNFPRPFLVEKAFPEDEVVIVEEARDQEFIYEGRVGQRLQFELNARSSFDGQPNAFAGAGGALKYNVWHSLEPRALVSLGVELTPPLGRQAVWEVQPFLTFGAHPGRVLVAQGEIVSRWEAGSGISATEYRLGLGGEVGRFVPMLEAGWTVPTVGARSVTLYPQLWIQLSRLGHVAASLGAALPTVGPGPHDPRLIAVLLWDFGDSALLRGW